MTDGGSGASLAPLRSRRRLGERLRGWVRATAGLSLGTVTGLVDLGYVVLAGLALVSVLAVPRARRATVRRIAAVAQGLTEVECRRLVAFLDGEKATDYSDRRALSYLAVRWPVGLLGGILLFLFVIGAGTAAGAATEWVTAGTIDGGEVGPAIFAYGLGVGLVLLYLDVAGIIGAAALDRWLARRFLGPSERELLERRVAELADSRAGIVEAVDAERRRIERDLHDGVQQRLVSLGMLLGRARRGRNPHRGDDLLRQAHEEAQQLLDDLREVAWRVYPTALDELGLNEALASVAERSSVPVRLDCRLTARLPRQVETAAYFLVSEAVTNAAKHSAAALVTVRIGREGDMLVVRIRDDGVGGADQKGGGLSGLARRVVALDGRFLLDSPPGGPTTVTAELPCGS